MAKGHMPAYYHIKFELYPTAQPKAPDSDSKLETGYDCWAPPRDTSIFDELPSHIRAPGREYPWRPPKNTTTLQSPPQTDRHLSPPNKSPNKSPVIDCGASRRPSREPSAGTASTGNIERISQRQWLSRTLSLPPSQTAAIQPDFAANDWRFGQLSIDSLDLTDSGGQEGTGATPMDEEKNLPALGPSFSGPGASTRAQVIQLTTKNTNIGWGIVHLYREGEETQALSAQEHPRDDDEPDVEDNSCTTLCIPAVPSYMSPADFLGFVGDKWRQDIVQFRMVMTPRMDKYLVLMRLRDHRRARSWREEFDGKVFNTVESQVCRVIFIKSITFEKPISAPDAACPASSRSGASKTPTTSGSLRPFPPPTASLVELPTCPVCLERMDDTSGLMTIPCQHVFHCKCLQNWDGSGCPICRYVNAGPGHDNSRGDDPESYDLSNPYTQPFGGPAVSNLCSICDSTTDLWICLICGNVGCGRYKGGHAKDHWKATAHSFSLELETQYIWDYAGDTWVHRLIREKGGSKIMELPGSTRVSGSSDAQEDVVPRAKLDNIGLEYTQLLSSQLESQRNYFEDMIKKIADKVGKASAEAEQATAQADKASRDLREVEDKLKALSADTVPQLERDLDRERTRAAKAQELARSLSRTLQEEKGVGEGLMARVEHVNKEKEELRARIATLEEERASLQELNRDLTMFISGSEKLKQLEEEGQVDANDVEGGSIGVAEKSGRTRRKK